MLEDGLKTVFPASERCLKLQETARQDWRGENHRRLGPSTETFGVTAFAHAEGDFGEFAKRIQGIHPRQLAGSGRARGIGAKETRASFSRVGWVSQH